MKSFLFAWNPYEWAWDSLEKDIQELNHNGSLSHIWSCKSHRIAEVGDRAFLIKLGKKTKVKGIIGAGYISSKAFLSEHWDGSGRLVNRVMIDFEDLTDRDMQPLILMETLKSGNLANQHWSIIASGTEIKPEIAKELEKIWFKQIQKKSKSKAHNTQKYFEGNPYNLQVTKYERNPYARQACLDYYGYSCVVCQINFEEKYGEIGIQYIHIHHLNPISFIKEQKEINPIEDLRPVCPNCHAMIHKRENPFTIEEMITKINLKV
ncbi:HNH endonuclease [Flavobacterium sp.]|uniref:HNH endonuclease n=1 Tax=Flavobacterium sp. TaxID=239 RepID=UPI0031DCBE22